MTTSAGASDSVFCLSFSVKSREKLMRNKSETSGWNASPIPSHLFQLLEPGDNKYCKLNGIHKYFIVNINTPMRTASDCVFAFMQASCVVLTILLAACPPCLASLCVRACPSHCTWRSHPSHSIALPFSAGMHESSLASYVWKGRFFERQPRFYLS